MRNISRDFINKSIIFKSPQFHSRKGLPTRNNAITAYFSQLYQRQYRDEMAIPSISDIPPYVIRFQDVALHVLHEQVLLKRQQSRKYR